MTGGDVIELLGLRPLPGEGGYYVESCRSDELLSVDALPDRYHGPRSVHTAIYYLLLAGDVSTMHRVASDEVFHYYIGDPVEMLRLRPDGSHSVITIGPDLRSGQRPQVVVPRGVWQGCRVAPGGSFALMGTTVAPGFDFEDYEQGDRAELLRMYPRCSALITALTPNS